MFIAGVKNNPANYMIMIDGSDLSLSRIDALKLCQGNNGDIELDTQFELSLAPPELADLEDMMIVIKFSF